MHKGSEEKVLIPPIISDEIKATKLSSTYSLFATLCGDVGSLVVQFVKLQSVKLLDVIVSTLTVLKLHFHSEYLQRHQ